jgi:hypothetical protein
MTSNQHPDDEQLQAYLQEPAADRFIEVSLHLASCVDCRQQLESLQNFRSIYRYIEGETLTEELQQRVDEFTQQSLTDSDYAAARDEIRNNPGMLKSALYSLSMPQQEPTQCVENSVSSTTEHKHGVLSMLREWFNWSTPVRIGFAAAAVITVSISILLNSSVVKDGANVSMTIASYQDKQSMRFIPRQKVPGVGFFSAANNYAKPYNNLQFTLAADNRLLMQWPPVAKATQYQVTLYRYSEGNKQLVKKVTTGETHAMVQLPLESIHKRFEWTLSGSTSEQVAFITSGGFVISQ